jgi:hypothetical protein
VAFPEARLFFYQNFIQFQVSDQLFFHNNFQQLLIFFLNLANFGHFNIRPFAISPCNRWAKKGLQGVCGENFDLFFKKNCEFFMSLNFLGIFRNFSEFTVFGQFSSAI